MDNWNAGRIEDLCESGSAKGHGRGPVRSHSVAGDSWLKLWHTSVVTMAPWPFPPACDTVYNTLTKPVVFYSFCVISLLDTLQSSYFTVYTCTLTINLLS